MEYLELLENPRGWYGQSRRHAAAARKGKRGRSRNPVGFDEFGNPIFISGYNPRRRRNPMARTKALALPTTFKGWTQGVDLMDAAAAAGGLAATVSLPGLIVPAPVTMTQKLWKTAVSFGTAIGAGAVGKAFISDSAGRSALIGGVAGATAQILAMFIPGFPQIGRPSSSRYIPSGRGVGRPFPESAVSEETRIITNVT